MGEKSLTAEDLRRVAEVLDVDVATVSAVAEVESLGGGFLADGRPKILFEAHVFSRLTRHEHDATHPEISSREWDRSLYGGGAKEHRRLQLAVSLDRIAALQSASWGMFQIMGFNYARCGFKDVQLFVNAMYRSEGDHLDAFAIFVISQRLDRALRERDWAAFARGYNGPAYAVNRYDARLAQAYARFSSADIATGG